MFPKLDDVVKADDVSLKGRGNFAASYVNWAKISHYLREHAPGWQPFVERTSDGGMVHAAPDGTFYLLIGFTNVDPEVPNTVTVPHAVMDHKMHAKSNPDARDISDAFVRGMCKAAAMLFGLGWRLWSKDDPFERDEEPAKRRPKAAAPTAEPFDSVEHALQSLGKCTMAGMIAAWGHQVKASGFQGVDLDNLREAVRERSAQLEDGETHG